MLSLFLIVAPIIYFLILVFVLKKEFKDALPALLLFLVLTIIFMNKLLFGHLSLAQKDFNNIQIPLFLFFRDALLRLHLPPIWNTTFCGGFDAFSNPLAGYLSMFNWVFLIGSSIYKSFNVFLTIQVLLCLAFSYLMLRTFNFSKAAAIVGAVVFAFNGFVTMRFSPGVGVEYLFAYKWLPLILAFTKLYGDTSKPKYLLGLAVSFAFSLEGNPNMVIAIGVLWGLFLLFSMRYLIGGVTGRSAWKLLLAPVLAIFIYAVKILPVVALFKSGGFRFVEAASGWRTSNFDPYMFPNAFLPIKLDFTNGVFTPGLLAIILFCFGFIVALIHIAKTRKQPFVGYWFVLTAFVLAFVLTIENPIFYFFYSLPILNRVTIVPAFVIFYLIPIVFFCAFGTEYAAALIKRLKLPKIGATIAKLFCILLALGIFAEVLLGPSLFGERSYTFNFAKMDYTKEPYDFPHYNALTKQPAGTFYIYDNPRLFIYPYAIALNNLTTLNGYTYYYGCQSNNYFENADIDTMKKYADYLLFMQPTPDPDLQLIDKVSLSTLLTHQSHAVFENKVKYLALYDTGWNDDIYIYKVSHNGNRIAIPNNSSPNGYIYAGLGVSLVTLIAIIAGLLKLHNALGSTLLRKTKQA